MTIYEQAKAWRLSHNLSADQLSELIGYSREAIFWFERGLTPHRTFKNMRYKQGDREIKPWVWRRFEMACSGVDAELRSGKKFNWGDK